VSYAFRPGGRKGDAIIDALRTRPGRPGPASSHVLKDRLPGDGRVVVFPGVVAVETRLGALLTGSEDEHGLWDASALAEGAGRAGHAVSELLEVTGLCPVRASPGRWARDARGGLGGVELRRLDLAAELRFADGRDGLALLDALGGMYAPRCKTVMWRKGAEPQTVYWVTEKSRRIKHRAYDKGVEAGTHAPGERVRVELQHRPPKSRRRRPDAFTRDELAALYGGALDGWAHTDRPTLRGEPEHVMAALLDRVDREQMTRRKARMLIGTLVELRLAGQGSMSDWAYGYAKRELRDAGVVLDRPVVEREVPVSRHLAELRGRFAA